MEIYVLFMNQLTKCARNKDKETPLKIIWDIHWKN